MRFRIVAAVQVLRSSPGSDIFSMIFLPKSQVSLKISNASRREACGSCRVDDERVGLSSGRIGRVQGSFACPFEQVFSGLKQPVDAVECRDAVGFGHRWVVESGFGKIF